MLTSQAANVLATLARYLGKPKIREYAYEADFACPKCPAGKKPKLGVNFAKWRFHCFRCGYSGRVRSLLNSFGADCGELRQVSDRAHGAGRKKRDIPGFQRLDPESVVGRQAYTLAFNRAFLAPSLVDTKGWGISEDPSLAGRLIIPIYDANGYLMQYAARAVWEDQEPKELFGAEEDGWAPRSTLAYGLYPPHPEVPMVLVEGIWDAERVGAACLDRWTLATLGSWISDDMLGTLLTFRPPQITLFFDGDAAGRRATLKAIQKLQQRGVRSLYVARCPDGKDPADLMQDEIRHHIDRAVPSFLYS